VTCKFGIQTLNASPIRHWDLALLSLPSTFHDTLIVDGRTELSLNYGMILTVTALPARLSRAFLSRR
jgi:hypothetical protein